MNKIIPLSILLMLGISSFDCKKDISKNAAISIEDLLVKNNEITGWTYSGAGWVASSNPELNGIIDGGSEIYIKYGFKEASGQKYTGMANNIETDLKVWVFNQDISANAIALFKSPDLNLSSALVWSDNPAGTEARYFRYSGLSQVLYFYRGKYIVLISIDTDSEESLSIIKQFAYNVDAKIKKVVQ
jgi:hypothetical protein